MYLTTINFPFYKIKSTELSRQKYDYVFERTPTREAATITGAFTAVVSVYSLAG